MKKIIMKQLIPIFILSFELVIVIVTNLVIFFTKAVFPIDVLYHYPIVLYIFLYIFLAFFISLIALVVFLKIHLTNQKIDKVSTILIWVSFIVLQIAFFLVVWLSYSNVISH